MNNYYQPITANDFNTLIEKDYFELEDVKTISKFIPSPLEKKFDTALKYSEANLVCSLVCKNIYKIIQVFNIAIKEDGDHDHMFPKEILKQWKDAIGDDKAGLIFFKAGYILGNGPYELKFDGKIPKKGFFSSRQIIADEWINDYMRSLGGYIISNVLRKTKMNTDHAFVAIAENTACFLVNAYPDTFDKNKSVRDIIVLLSKM